MAFGKKVLGLVLLGAMFVAVCDAQPVRRARHRFHADDCTSITNGYAHEVCLQLDNEKLYMCQPTAGLCDTAGEWIEVRAGEADFIDFIPVEDHPHGEGRIFYDSDDDCFKIFNAEADIALNVGEETWVPVRNETGSTITNGQIVYASGGTGQLPTIALARADALATLDVLGMATHDIEHNTTGYVTTEGIVRDVDTDALGTGAILYLSESTAGAFTTTAPSGANWSVHIGIVVISNPSTGSIYVHHPNIDEIHRDATVVDEWTFDPYGSGTVGEYDLGLGDDTADYGALRVGRTGLYSSSFSAGGMNLGGAMLFRQESNIDVGNDPGIEFAFSELGNTMRFLIPESGAGNAMTFIRSGTFAGPYSQVTGNDSVLCDTWTSYDANIDCDTSGTGADLFVQDDLEVEGTLFLHETINLEGATANGNQVIIQVGADPGSDVTLTLPIATDTLAGLLDIFSPTAGISTDHGAGAVSALTDLAAGLCTTGKILEDQGANWVCIDTPGGGGTPTRIEDAATTTYVDTEAVAGKVTIGGTDVVLFPGSSGNLLITGLDCSAGDQYITTDVTGLVQCGTDDGGGGANWEALTNSADTATVYTSDNTSETVTFDFQAAFGATSQFTIKTSVGNPTAGTLLEIEGHDASVDLLLIDGPTADFTFDAGGHLVLPQVNDAVTPTLSFGDGDSGFYQAANDRVDLTLGGALMWKFQATKIESAKGAGAEILVLGGSVTVPIYTFSSDSGSGVSNPAADSVSLIAKATEILRASNDGTDSVIDLVGDTTQAGAFITIDPNGDAADDITIGPDGTISMGLDDATAQLILAPSNDAVTPTLELGSGEGFYQPTNGMVSVAINAAQSFRFQATGACSFSGGNSTGCLLPEVASATNATVVPVFGDTDTGLGRNAVDELSLIAGATEMMRLDQDTTNIDSVFTKVVAADDPDADTCTDTGDGSPGALTITPTTSYVEITNSDADGCDITMGETGVVDGARAELVVVSNAGTTVNFADTATVTELNGAFAAAVWESITLRYVGDRWVEEARTPGAGDGVGSDGITDLSDVTAVTGTGTVAVFSAAPVFTGDATGATPSVDDNDTSVATTAFVQAETVASSDIAGTIGGGLNLGAGVVDDPNMATDDFGDFSCAGSTEDCLIDNGAVTADAVSAALKDGEACFKVFDPVTDEQITTVWRAPYALTVNEIYCEVADGTSVLFDFVNDDGTPDGVNGSDITCTTSGVTDGTLGGTTAFAIGHRLDIDVGAVTGSTSVSFCLNYSIDNV